MYCKLMGITQVNYAQKKMLTMSRYEKVILMGRDDRSDTKILIMDYYVNNAYRANKVT